GWRTVEDGRAHQDVSVLDREELLRGHMPVGRPGRRHRWARGLEGTRNVDGVRLGDLVTQAHDRRRRVKSVHAPGVPAHGVVAGRADDETTLIDGVDSSAEAVSVRW